MTDPALLDDRQNWDGGFYELDIELGRADRDRLQRALTRLWSAAGVEGCRPEPRAGGAGAGDVPLTIESLTRYGHLAGVVTLPAGHRVVGGCVPISYAEDEQWLSFHLPLAALAQVEQRIGGFPFDERSGVESLRWRRPLDDWLGTVAQAVHDEVGIAAALIGFELDAYPQAGARFRRGLPAGHREAVLLPGAEGLVLTPAAG